MRTGTCNVLLPLMGIASFFLVWWFAGVTWGIDPAVLPGPEDVLHALIGGFVHGTIIEHIGFTVVATLSGMVVGCSMGFLAGLWVGESVQANRFLFPIVLGMQSMPIVAVGPLLIVWFGIGISSKIALVAISCFFPLFVSTVAGVNSAKPELLDLYRVCGAGRLRTLFDVKLPGALHYVFGGLEISVALGLISCVVAEFIASQKGLGYLIKSLSGQLDVSMMFAAIITLAVMGACGAHLVRLAHRYFAGWEPAQVR